MTDVSALPAPLVPIDVRFTGDDVVPMPMHGRLKTRLDIIIDAREFRATVLLMMRAWAGKPAASLPNYPEAMHRLASESEQWWRHHGARVLSHFVLCSDDRYYHPDLAVLALERWRRAGQARPARKLDVAQAAWQRLRVQVFARDGFMCAYCGSEATPLHCDHIVPVAAGGMSVLGNLITACAACNTSKHAKSLDEWEGA